MDKEMTQLSLEEFVNVLASDSPVPGGGGVSAYAAALGVALGRMVGSLTSGKKKYAETQDELEAIMERLQKYQKDMLDGIQADADSFLPLAKAYSMPKDSPEQLKEREEILEKLLFNAASAPLSLMKKIYYICVDIQRLSYIGSKLAISDVGAAASMCNAASDIALLNVYINTGLMKNKETADRLEREASKLNEDTVLLADETKEKVLLKIKG